MFHVKHRVSFMDLLVLSLTKWAPLGAAYWFLIMVMSG